MIMQKKIFRWSLSLLLLSGEDRKEKVKKIEEKEKSVKWKNPGDYSRGVTPVLIPNTVVKPSSADGTALVTVWESRTLPGFFIL